jgi:hypothetical protein
MNKSIHPDFFRVLFFQWNSGNISLTVSGFPCMSLLSASISLIPFFRQVLVFMSVVVGDPLIPVKPQVSLFCQDGDDCIIPVQDAPCQDQEPEVSFEGGKFFRSFLSEALRYIPQTGRPARLLLRTKTEGPC